MTERISFLDREHGEILEKLHHASDIEGETGSAFGDILKIFSYHLDREEATVVPLLRYLSERTFEERDIDFNELENASMDFESQYDTMLEEHGRMVELMAGIERKSVGKREVSDLVEELKRHIEIEEEFMYPAAVGAMDLVEWEKGLESMA